MHAQVIPAGLAFPEGLAWSEREGAMIVTATQGGHVYRLDPATGSVALVADVGGGANNTTLADDGGIVVAQNSGIRAATYPDVEIRPARPGLQRIAPDGRITYLLSEGVNAPNDVVAHPDGSLYFTDPGLPRQGAGYTGGRIMRFDVREGLSVIADGLFYPNGIAIDPQGAVLVTERHGLMRIETDGRKTLVVDTLTDHGGDGLCIDERGLYYVSMRARAGAQAINADGQFLDFVPFPGGRTTTNCCFGGPDMNWLFMTDSMGDLCIVRDMPTRGPAPPLARL